MKRLLFSLLAVFISFGTMQAQRIEVVDTEGNPIPLVYLLTEEGNLVGSTDMNGVLADAKGEKTLAVTHVAYKPKLVEVSSLVDGRIVLEDLGYDIKEVVITPKPLIYVETYYRAYAYINDSLRFYQAGIMPNSYDPVKKKISTGSHTNSYGDFCPAFGANITWGARVMEFKAGEIGKITSSDFMPNGRIDQKYHSKTESTGSGRWAIRIPDGIVGRVERTDNQLRVSVDAGSLQMYANKVDGKDRLLKKRQEKEYEYQFTEIVNCDADGDSEVGDLVMYSHDWKWNGRKGRYRFIIETYTVDRGYMTKAEYSDKKKELKKTYKAIMTLDALEDFAQQHGIPALSPTMRRAILGMKSKK